MDDPRAKSGDQIRLEGKAKELGGRSRTRSAT
jgi:hypothetical protein